MPLASVIDACGRGELPSEVLEARSLLRSTTVSHLDVLAKGFELPTTERVLGWRGAASLGLLPRAPVPVLSGRLLLGGGAKMTDGDTAKLLCRDRTEGDRRVEDEVEAWLRGLDEAGLIDGVGSVHDVHVEHVSHAYVLQDPNYREGRQVLLDYLLRARR